MKNMGNPYPNPRPSFPTDALGWERVEVIYTWDVAGEMILLE